MVMLRHTMDRCRNPLTGLILLLAVGLLAAACASAQPGTTEIPPIASTAPASDADHVDHADHVDSRVVQVKQVDVAEISRHPTDMPDSANYTLYADGQFQNPVDSRK